MMGRILGTKMSERVCMMEFVAPPEDEELQHCSSEALVPEDERERA